ncbi:MAG: DPP IV N-terminal domain-containing protein [Bacteroidota bacterium]
MNKEDYRRAESRLIYNTAPLVDRSFVLPNWLAEGRFGYEVLVPNGKELVLVDPKGPQVRRMGAENVPKNTTTEQSKSINIRTEVSSPDGRYIAFIRDWNLWIRESESNKEIQLTKDGVENFGYATDNAGWRQSDRPVLVWSPDSRKLATFQQDQRNVSDMYLVETKVGAPKLKAWKYPLPEDPQVALLHRVIIEIETQNVIRLKVNSDPHRSSLCDDIYCDGKWTDVIWSEDNNSLAFLSTSRDHKETKLRIANAETGDVREVYQELTSTQFESGANKANWRYLPETNEFIWYTEREGWGHLYLYDLENGEMKNRITKGDWAVWDVLHLDREKRRIYFTAGGREARRDPYFAHFYGVNLDGSELKLLTPEDGHHQIQISPDGKYFVDNYSQPHVPTVSVLRDMDGELIVELERADISRLMETGWKPPTPITVKSRDDTYDLYGLMFTPSDLDSTQKYPVVNYIYPGPQAGSVRGRAFLPSRRDHQSLAELGFVVVAIDGTCNPLRSKAFHDACYGNMADNTLPDQIYGLQQLAERYPFMDLDKVGVWGHSGGGFAAAAALFRYPDFYKVGISESGNHDNRNYEDDWGERYIGLLQPTESGTSNYSQQANQEFAPNLKGKLLLAHGGMDDNVPPYNTYLVVEALIEANKDFDLIILPNQRHGFRGQSGLYMMRRRWDYFVKHLKGMEPPKEYQLVRKVDPRTE